MIKSTVFMRRLIFTSLIFLCISGICEAWTSRTYQLVVVNSMKIMPLSFRTVMLRHKEELLTGCLRPDEHEETAHRYDLEKRKGYLQDRIAELSEAIPKKIYKHVPFRELAVDFGRLSHYISDLNDPLILSEADLREEQYRTDFAIYLEKSIPLFPWIFDGHQHALLEKHDLPGYIHSIAARTVQPYSLIGESYFPNGALVSSDTFDPKSLPFGIASLSYSRSISNTVQLWFYVWKKSRADISYTPFYSKKD